MEPGLLEGQIYFVELKFLAKKIHRGFLMLPHVYEA